MRSGTPSLGRVYIGSRHSAWHAMSDATFSNATVDISRATSCGVTQVVVTPRGLARPKGLLLGILVGVGLVLKF
jgi:hypothetical protein